MTLDVDDKSGCPRTPGEIQGALLWAKKKIVRADFGDPEGLIHCVVIKDALEELLMLRAIIANAKEN
jgi:hypothetical protein